MKKHKPHKKDQGQKMKDDIGDTMYHTRVTKEKLKYKHKNHWLEEDDDIIVSYKIKKKKKL